MGLFDVVVARLRTVSKWVLYPAAGIILIGVLAFILTTAKCEIRAVGPVLFDRAAVCDGKPAQSEQSPPRLERADVMRGPDEINRLRAKHTLRLLDAEDVLATAPTGTFGFVFAGTFASKWKSRGRLTIRNVGQENYFEIQKRLDSRAYIVGYMRGDVADSTSSMSAMPVEVKLQSERFRATDVLVAIPLSSVKDVSQSDIYAADGRYKPVLELRLIAF